MSSSYNMRPRAAEVMVSGTEVHLIRARVRRAVDRGGRLVVPIERAHCRKFIVAFLRCDIFRSLKCNSREKKCVDARLAAKIPPATVQHLNHNDQSFFRNVLHFFLNVA